MLPAVTPLPPPPDGRRLQLRKAGRGGAAKRSGGGGSRGGGGGKGGRGGGSKGGGGSSGGGGGGGSSKQARISRQAWPPPRGSTAPAACLPRLDGGCFETLAYPEQLALAERAETTVLPLPKALATALLDVGVAPAAAPDAVLGTIISASALELQAQRRADAALATALATLTAQARNVTSRVLLLDVAPVAHAMTSAAGLLRSAEVQPGLKGRAKLGSFHQAAHALKGPPPRSALEVTLEQLTCDIVRTPKDGKGQPYAC